MFFPKRFLLAVLAMLAAAGVPARADTIVTACGSETAAGGLNLFDGTRNGGKVIVRCADGSNLIRLSGRLILRFATEIDGEGHLTLIGAGNGAMFALDGPLTLTLRGLTIRNPVPTPAPPSAFAAIVYDSADERSVELYNVTVADTLLPFVVRRLLAVDSIFTGNGDRKVPDAAAVMAGDLTLKNTTVSHNLSRPFSAVWRGDPLTSGKKITGRISDSRFTDNARPAFWAIGDLFVRNSRFENNGAGGSFTPGLTGQLYGGAAYLELMPSLAGALDLYRARATISRSQFVANNGLAAGAVLSAMGRLTVRSTVFEGNAAQTGGAISFLSTEQTGENRLDLDHVTFRKNRAARDGGALFLQGAATGDAMIFAQNSAEQAGGAIAVAGPGIGISLPPAAAGLAPPPPAGFVTQIAFSRAVFADNSAKSGGAVEASGASLRLGDALIVRNHTSASASGAVSGTEIELAAATIAANDGAGVVATGASGRIRFGNAILAANSAGNCRIPVGRLEAFGPDLQFPGNDCGARAVQADPGLDTHFAPAQSGPAGTSGSTVICSGHDLVEGRDVYGKDRQGARCAIGAAEPDLERKLRDMLPFDIPFDSPRLLRWLVLFLAVCFLFGLLLGLWRRRKRRGWTRP